ncbi:MAG: M56 family metallopeptidase [Burkholderiales bacterium]
MFHLCRRVARGRHLGQILNAVAAQSREDFCLIDCGEALAFSAGVIRPRVFVSRGLMQNVSSRELKAIVEHERAHGRRHDNLQKWLAFLCTFPSLSQKRPLADLSLAAEQCCDAAAARALGDPLLVAEVLVKVQKLKRRGAHDICGFDGSNLEVRVSALLQPAKEDATHPVLLVMLLAGALGLIVFAPDPLHHLLERLLDWLRVFAS